MYFKLSLACVLATATALIPAPRAQADGGDFAAGIVTGVIGSAIARDIQRNNKKKTYRSTVNSYQRQQNRDTQTALNYFGFPAGTPDGVLGRNSRAAISQYQIFMGYPATGYLSDVERGFLITSYQRAIAGGAATTQMVAANPQGTRGLLLSYRNQNSVTQGMVPVQPPMVTTVVTPQTTTATAVAPPPVPPVTAPTEASTETASGEWSGNGEPALPTFMAGSGAAPSLASHCNKVNLLTTSNGGLTQVSAAASADPELVLGEQFCLARTYAIAQSEDLIAGLQGVSTAQVTEQCANFAPAMQDMIGALSLKPQPEVSKEVASFILSSGMSPDQLSATARICLGSGYRTDAMDVAIGSSLILYALGEQAYGELLGHHLSQGYGASKRMDLAVGWYEPAFAAMEAGANPLVSSTVFPERVAMLRQATAAPQGGTTVEAVPATQQPALPSFTVAQ